MIKLDIHLHSHYSDDGVGTPKELIKILTKKGLHGMALTDHNIIQGALKAQKIAPKNFIVIPGVEISTKDGHILALNVTQNFIRNQPVEETIDTILDEGGLPIVPHLFRNMSGIKKEKLKEIHTKIPAIEVFNGCSLPATNLKTAHIAKELNLGGTGGTDSHEPQFAGDAYTTITTTDLSLDSVLEEILKKKTWGDGITMPLTYRRDRMVKSLRQFFQRGLRRI
jgi:predicted metal-dependent phosphoesterase TrpH